MNHSQLAKELVRGLRGRRSQAALSRWLGFKTNVVYTWESGRSEPSIQQLFQLAAKTGVHPKQALERFYRSRPAWLEGAESLGRAQVAALLEQERGGVPVLKIARETGVSRHSLARYLRAEADMRLTDFLRVLDYCSRRLLDFVALWVDVNQVPCAAAAWRKQELARRAAYERPWSHAVLRYLELARRGPAAHNPHAIAGCLGIDVAEVKSCLSLLEQSGQIRRKGRQWLTDRAESVELSADRDAARKLAAWWVSVAAERAQQPTGMFAYNLCSVATKDLQRIAQLQRDCLRQIRAIVAESKPAERVALICVQVFGLDGKLQSEQRSWPVLD
jgi:transcriptional regulator with XRE-family HTH domain